jgi:hypothetical protein
MSCVQPEQNARIGKANCRRRTQSASRHGAKAQRLRDFPFPTSRASRLCARLSPSRAGKPPTIPVWTPASAHGTQRVCIRVPAFSQSSCPPDCCSSIDPWLPTSIRLPHPGSNRGSNLRMTPSAPASTSEDSPTDADRSPRPATGTTPGSPPASTPVEKLPDHPSNPCTPTPASSPTAPDPR